MAKAKKEAPQSRNHAKRRMLAILQGRAVHFDQLDRERRYGMRVANRYRYVLKNGGRFYGPVTDAKIRKGPAKACFANAYRLAKRKGLQYVEGYTLTTAGDCLDVMHHAWCADAEGKVIETTWQENGLAYFGIPFDLSEVEQYGCVIDGRLDLLL